MMNSSIVLVEGSSSPGVEVLFIWLFICYMYIGPQRISPIFHVDLNSSCYSAQNPAMDFMNCGQVISGPFILAELKSS
jgi:hypothetical protein